MNAIYSFAAASGFDPAALTPVWTQEGTGLPPGYVSLVPVQLGGRLVLFAYTPTTPELDAYELTAGDPAVRPIACKARVPGKPWDALNAFVLGNIPYLFTYRKVDGQFGFFTVGEDLKLSDPYLFFPSHTTPAKGLTTVVPYTSLNGQYVLGYDTDTGRVENFSVKVVPSSAGESPPLLAQNVWYHLWAKGWTHFSFFQLGGSNFFFKINTAKLNVNIDHMQDDPAAGSLEIGSHLESQLPDALAIDLAAIIPWIHGDPYLLTYIASSGLTAVYHIHPDCQGWTLQTSGATVRGATIAVPYRLGDRSYVLLYQGQKPRRKPR
jgi:hypothetical protein